MSGIDICCNSHGWNRRKAQLLLAIGIVVPAAILFAAKSFIGTSEAVAQQRQPVQQATSRGVAGPQQAPQRQTATSKQNISIVAIINGDQVTRQQLARECVRRYGKDVLQRMANKQLLLTEIQKRNIVITQQDVEQEILVVSKKFGIPPEQYLSLLESRRNITADQYKREVIWPALALRQLAAGQIQVSQQEVDARINSELGPRVQVLMIALDNAQKAQQVLQMAQKDPSQFSRLAKDHSVDPNSAAIGGMVPVIRMNTIDSKIEQVAYSLKPGQISNIVQVKDQYLIMRCEKHFPAAQVTQQQRQAFQQRVVDEIKEQKLAASADALLRQIQANTVIKNVYNDPNLSKQMPGVVATVGAVQITERQLAEECIARHGLPVLDGEINRSLLMQQLKKNKITITDADLQTEVGRAADAYGMLKLDGSADVEKWLEYVTQEPNVTVELYVRDAVWPSVALKKLVQDSIQVTEEDMKKGFEANFGQRVECLAIVSPDQKSATRVWQMASKNPTPEFFGELASQYSIEPASKSQMGKVPPIQRYGGRPNLEQVAFALKKGEISGLVNVGENWIILYCLGQTKPVVQDYNSVKAELHKDIREKKLRLAMGKLFDEIKGNSQIDNFLAGTSQVGKGAQAPKRQAEIPNGRVPFQQNRRK